MDDRDSRLATNPPTKPSPHRPDDAPSMDSRTGHGLDEDQVVKSKK